MTEESKASEGANADKAKDSPPTYTTDDLLRGGKEAVIVHGEEVYHLRLTRNDKLILQK